MHLLKKGGFFLILTGLLQFGKVTVSGKIYNSFLTRDAGFMQTTVPIDLISHLP